MNHLRMLIMKAYMNSRVRITGWILIGVIAGAGTMHLQAIARNSPSRSIPIEQIQEFATAYGYIKAGYVEATKDQKLMQDAITGMVSGLDPHSQYLSAEDLEEFKDSTMGKFVGLGIEITQEDGLVKIIAPIEDTPAHRAGLQPGDLITRIDDTEVRDITLTQAVQRMRGKPDTSVTLTIYRQSEKRTFKVDITRAEIHTRSVKSKVIEPGYGWVRISQFQENTVASLIDHINQLTKQEPNLKGLVLDLRNDPGGLLNAAVATSAVFLERNAVVVSTRGQNKDIETYYLAAPQFYLPNVRPPKTTKKVDANGKITYEQGTNTTGRLPQDPLAQLPAIIKTVPMVILVNEGSASASEIVAGALQDHGRATIMGATTFGKGSVQSTIPLTDNSALKMTIAMYYTPSDHSIQATGIVPDIALPENADGSSPLSVLYTREADLKDHIVLNDEDKNAAAKLREERDKLMKKLEEDKDALPKIPEYGSKDDFRLTQALNYLQGNPVIALDTAKIEAEKAKEKAAASKDGATAQEKDDSSVKPVDGKKPAKTPQFKQK